MSDSALIIDREPKGLRIALGVICLVLGLVALIWPQATLLVVAIVFGLQLIAAGLIRVFAAIALKDSAGWWRAVSGILGGLTVIAGIICFFRPNTSLLVLALFSRSAGSSTVSPNWFRRSRYRTRPVGASGMIAWAWSASSPPSSCWSSPARVWYSSPASAVWFSSPSAFWL